MTRAFQKASTAEALEIIDGRPVVVSVSGGKDSTAMALLLREMGIPVHAYLHLDTGWETEETRKYVDWLRKNVLTDAPFVVRGRPGGMVQLIRERAMFPNRLTRFCTQELKLIPAKEYYREVSSKTSSDVVVAVGVRAAESSARSKMVEWEESNYYDGAMWRPLIDASGSDVIQLHSDHGIAPNGMYLDGAQRVGCWPCIHSRKAEIRRWSKDAVAVDRLRKLEAEVNAEHARRVASPDSRRDNLAIHHGFFTAKRIEPDARVKKPQWPIDKVISWAHSGAVEQPRMFDPEDVAGCMRWGLCETPKD